MTRILVCGGRDYNDHAAITRTLSHFDPLTSILIEGGAPGADTHAADHASDEEWVAVECFPARWSLHGKAAGPIRNQQMIDEGRPDLVIAFPGGRGTADMIRRAHAAGIPVQTGGAT